MMVIVDTYKGIFTLMQENKEDYFYDTIYCPNSFIYLMHKKNGFFLFSPTLD
jgi:hypothetical protein